MSVKLWYPISMSYIFTCKSGGRHGCHLYEACVIVGARSMIDDIGLSVFDKTHSFTDLYHLTLKRSGSQVSGAEAHLKP